MKHSFLSLILVLVSSFLFAQTQKIGHLNSAEILQSMPEFKQMQDAIEKKKTEYTKVLESMYKEYETKSKDIQENGKNMMEAILEAKIQELQDLQKRIQGFEEKVQNDLEKYQLDLMKPINDKYMKLLEEVAKEGGYTYILDIAAGGVPYFPKTEYDVTEAVKKKVAASAPASPAPASTPKPSTGTTPKNTSPK
ncbi:MAG: OmpH family outer membrane protein [Chitinophagales bacterium]|nr:OmpH family outer membrane protein [Chitinophagales bacterium]